MNDPPGDRRRRQTSPIPIAGPSKGDDEPEPMVVGTPTDSAAPAMLNPASKGPRSPIRKWHHQLSHNIQSALEFWKCIKKTDSQTSSPEEEEFRVVIQPRIRPTTLVPKNPTLKSGEKGKPEIQEDAAHSTHLQSMLIRRTQCFVVATEKAMKHERYRNKLGICVAYNKPCKKCKNKDKCPVCKVCPHVFKCSCMVRYMATEWCPHVHVMQELTKGMYLKTGMMFIHDNCKFTELRHLRAFIQGPTKMKQMSDGTWEEQFEYILRTKIYNVTELPDRICVCPDDKKCPLCDACLCKYECFCEDNRIDLQVCQHIHNVAMQKHRNRDALFANFEEFRSEYPHLVDKNEDLNLRYYIEQEHEMSLLLKINKIVKIKKQSEALPDEWQMRFYDNDDDKKIIDLPEIIVKENLVKQCHCDKESATKANSCVRCKICDKHYTCNCGTGKFTICRHMHVVAQLEKKCKETPEDRYVYLERLLTHALSREDAEIAKFKYVLRLPQEDKLEHQSPLSFSEEELDAFVFQRPNVEL